MFENEIFRVILRTLRPQNTSFDVKSRTLNALLFFEQAFRSPYFRESILNFGNSSEGFVKKYSLQLDNQGVFRRLINAVEQTDNIEKNIADMCLFILNEDSPNGEIGYSEPDSPIIYTYRQFIDLKDQSSLSLPELAGHFAHEWTHLLGFTHPDPPRASNRHITSRTVPFVVQNLVVQYVAEREQDFIFIL